MEWPREIQPDDHLLNMRTLLSQLPGSFSPRGVIHVGAHKGEEVELYKAYGFQDVLLIEANPISSEEIISAFLDDPNVTVMSKAIGDRVGEEILYIHTSRSGSTEPASLLPLDEFKEIVTSLHTPHQIQVPITTLDELVKTGEVNDKKYNMLVIDVQGAELMVLRGARSALSKFDVVIVEVAMRPLYFGAAMEEEVISFLMDQGFKPIYSIDHQMYSGADFPSNRFVAWGECLLSR